MEKSSNEVASPRMIQCGFAPDRAIDHPFQRSGYLNQRNTTHIGRGGKSSQIVDSSPSNDYDDIVSPQPDGKQPVVNGRYFFRRLDSFFGRNAPDVSLDTRGRERVLNYFA